MTLRAVIIQHGLQQGTIIQPLLCFLPEQFDHLRNRRRIAATQHDGFRVLQTFIQIIHQLADTSQACEFFAKL